MTATEIKAELHDLQSHICNGRLTISPDGDRDKDDRSCSGCARILTLQSQLREKAAVKA